MNNEDVETNIATDLSGCSITKGLDPRIDARIRELVDVAVAKALIKARKDNTAMSTLYHYADDRLQYLEARWRQLAAKIFDLERRFTDLGVSDESLIEDMSDETVKGAHAVGGRRDHPKPPKTLH